MLLVLTRPCRGADLAALDLRNRFHVPEGVVSSLATYPSNRVHHIFSSLVLRRTSACV